MHPSLEPPLRDTLGTIIFQDQVLEVAQAFAGFSVGEAEGLRRAMSRKRSAEAIEAHHRRFVEGAMATHPDVTEELAEQVFTMVSGFSGFGFPKAHGAAFGLLAYQSTWLRVHYGPEFLCALLDEQPMGFYPPDALVHEAQRRGIEVLAPDVNCSEVGCTVRADGAVQVGLGYVLGVRADEVAALVAARHEGGPFRSLEDLASRAGRGPRGAREARLVGRLRRAGRRRSPRRAVAARRDRARCEGARRGGAARARARPARAAEAGAAVAVGRDGRRLRDDRADGLDASARAPARAAARRRRGRRRRAGAPAPRRPRARRRPRHRAPAAGDREGDHVPAARGRVRDGQRHRLAATSTSASGSTVRTEPLVVVEGRLERHASAGGAINIVARRFERLEAGDRVAAQVKDFSLLDAIELARQAEMQRAAQELAATGTDDFRAVAPPVMNFGAGRRR